MFLDDSYIEQINNPETDSRYYISSHDPNMRYPSVTRLKDYFNYKGIEAIRAWHQKNIEKMGAEEAEIHRRKGAKSGTKIHTAIETGDLTKLDKKEITRYNNIQKIVTKIDLPLQEKKILWVDPNDKKVGFGGTLDAVAIMDRSCFTDEQDVEIGTGSTNVILDWKNVKTFYNLDFYIGYYLQAAAYAAGFNRATDRQYAVCESLIVFTTARTLKLVYLDKRCIMWYWQNFREIARCYAYQEEFDYEAFKAHSIGHFTEDGSISDYLPKQVYLQEK